MGKNLIYMHAYRTLHIMYIYIYILYCILLLFHHPGIGLNDKAHKSHKSLRWRSRCFAVDFRKNFMVQFLFIWQDIRKVCSTRNQQIRSSWHEVTPFPSHQGNWLPRFWKWIDGLDWHGIHGIHPIFSLHLRFICPSLGPASQNWSLKKPNAGAIWLYPLVQEETKRAKLWVTFALW